MNSQCKEKKRTEVVTLGARFMKGKKMKKKKRKKKKKEENISFSVSLYIVTNFHFFGLFITYYAFFLLLHKTTCFLRIFVNLPAFLQGKMCGKRTLKKGPQKQTFSKYLPV